MRQHIPQGESDGLSDHQFKCGATAGQEIPDYLPLPTDPSGVKGLWVDCSGFLYESPTQNIEEAKKEGFLSKRKPPHERKITPGYRDPEEGRIVPEAASSWKG